MGLQSSDSNYNTFTTDKRTGCNAKLGKITTWVSKSNLFCTALGNWLKNLLPLFHLIEGKLKPIVIRLLSFSRALHQLHVFPYSSDWFTGYCLCAFWLARVIALLLVKWHSGHYFRILGIGLELACNWGWCGESFQMQINSIFLIPRIMVWSIENPSVLK